VSKGRGILGAVLLLGGTVAVAALIVSELMGPAGHGAAQATTASPPSFADSAAFAPSLAPTAAFAAVVPTSAPPTASKVPLVPVVSYWSTQRSVSMLDITRLWLGTEDAFAQTHFQTLAISPGDLGALAAALALAPRGSVQILSPDGIKAAVRADTTTLGLIPAGDVTPDVRALALDGVSLFGSARIHDVSTWPLMVASTTDGTFSIGAEWTLAAGGDVNLDRRVYYKADQLKYGPDYPWSAGYAFVPYYDCCGLDGSSLAVARDVGPAGAFRDRLADADLALVNLEGSAPNDWITRDNSLVFTFDPALLIGLRNAGIDAVTLANNHIRNGGDSGVVETCQNLDAANIEHTGAGADVVAARQPAWLSAAGLRVAVLGYSAVGSPNWAAPDRAGAAPLDPADVEADIRSARAAGAQIVIVMPHWGEEYSFALSSEQKDDAAAFVAAGANLVLGSHSHWVGAVQSIDGPAGPAFVDYSLGDLLFNLNHDTRSQEGVIATMTFSGTRLQQVDLQPTVMIDGAQVGLMDPAGDGAAVLDDIRHASRGLLDW
jgi:poly-gamma-glutamate synthesis protein (capsule biosynthesis protein)